MNNSQKSIKGDRCLSQYPQSNRTEFLALFGDNLNIPLHSSAKRSLEARSHRCFLLAIISSSLIFSGCSESKLTQCEQIFRIAAQVNNSSKNVSYTNKDSSEMRSWLEAARTMNQAAENVKALHINNSELIKYQNQLVTIYSIYSQATYDAVAARESKNLEALKFARTNAQKAGQMQQNLIGDINNYCLNK